jgi:hypothetical protein
MRRRCAFAVVSLGGVLLVALPSSVAAASPKPLPLSARLLLRGEFVGFTLEASIPYKTAKAWAATNTSLTPTQHKAEVARLTREGFKELLAEFLDNAQGPQNGLAWVMQLGSAASARSELAAETRFEKAQGHAKETFRVGAIPRAFGFGGSNGSSGGGENIIFADGTFLYLVGNAWSGSTHNPRRAALIDAAIKLYTRVHGHPAG